MVSAQGYGLEIGVSASFMKIVTLTMTLIFAALAAPFAHAAGESHGALLISPHRPMNNSIPQDKSGLSQSAGEQEALHKQCVQAGDLLDRSVTAMVPGRTWTWQLDSSRSRGHLDELLRALQAFRDADVAFEESLSPEQRSNFNSHFTATSELFKHLEQDVQSLDDELRKGFPTRWHVTNDVLDMRKEINHWRKLHQHLAADLGLT